MARERMVTRTVEQTIYSVMTLDTDTANVQVCDYVLGNIGKDDALKVLKKQHETDTYKLVKIVGSESSSILYGMSEAEFIKLAKPLPPRAQYNSAE